MTPSARPERSIAARVTVTLALLLFPLYVPRLPAPGPAPRPAHAAVCPLPLCGFGAALRAAPQALPHPTFRAGVDMVAIDVSVFDARHHPVRGLTADDFTILEDHQPRAVAAFAAVTVGSAPPAHATWIQSVAPDVRTNAVDDRRIVVLVMDDALWGNGEVGARAAALAHQVIDRLGPNDLASVVFTGGVRTPQDFTGDHATLLATIDGIRAGGPTAAPGVAAGCLAVRELQQIVGYLSEVTDQRKVIIDVSGGIGGNGMRSGRGGCSVPIEARTLFAQAQAANVTVYGLEPVVWAGHEVLEALADATGGFIVTPTTAPDAALDRLFDETSAYYLLGYRPAESKGARHARRIEVRVDRRGLDVRSRQVPSVATDEDGTAYRIGQTALSPLTRAISGLLPVPDVPLEVTAAPFAVPDRRGRLTAMVAIVLGIREPGPAIQPAETVELQTSAFDPTGRPRGSWTQTAHVVLREADTADETLADAQYEVFAQIPLGPGRYRLRVAARNVTRDRTGSVYTDVVVPDFSSERLSLSGVVIETQPAPVSTRATPLADMLPIVPTTARVFASTSQVSAFMRVYEAGARAVAPATMATRIVDDHDNTVADAISTLAASAFDSAHAADYDVDVPVAPLTSGRHLLEIRASLPDGSVQRREVVFSIK